MQQSTATATWRWAMGITVGLSITLGTSLFTLHANSEAAINHKQDVRITKTEDLAYSNALALAVATEGMKGMSQYRDQLIQYWEAQGKNFEKDMQEMKEAIIANRKDIRAHERKYP